MHEHVGAGGFAGRSVPASLVREGRAMRSALVADLTAAGHDVFVEADLSGPPDKSVDGVWLIAPETGGVHARVARRMESRGAVLLGSSAAAIARASNKVTLARLLTQYGIPHPKTRILRENTKVTEYPVVVKPSRGAGCVGVYVAATVRELREAVALARADAGREPLLVQRYVDGIPASVSLLADGTRAMPLALNRQQVKRRVGQLSYAGGGTPFDHPLAARALEVAVRACELFPGLRGFVGVDLVLTDAEAVVIEVNPRLTTAYLGVRAAIDANVAAMALAACRGELPPAAAAQRRVRFAASGRVFAA